MELSGEKAQLVNNYNLYIAIWENTKPKEKRDKIEKYLMLGANINAPLSTFENNTPLHIAVKKAEVDIVKLLLERGADVTCMNSADETPVDVAITLKSDAKEEIISLLKNHSQQVPKLEQKDFLMQDKNTGVRGHLYETKLLSLVLLRAANDNNIEDYYLASNMSGIGVFDDICFKYNVKGRNKSIRLFLQAKHKELPKKGRLTVEDVMKPEGDLALCTCFDSFLKIKNKIDPKKCDPFFVEPYENVEYNFIIYTSAEESFLRKRIGRNERSPKIHYLIYTGGKKAIFQFDYKDDDIITITQGVQKMRIKSLAQNFIEFIFGEKDKYKHMMEDDLIKKYHCVLARIVTQNCSITQNYINAKFRSDFFIRTDPIDVLLKQELCKVMIEKCCKLTTKVKAGIVNEFTQLPKEPSSAALSKFIGVVVTYDAKYNRLKVLDNVSKRGLKSNDIKLLNEHLKHIHANSTTISEAIIKAGEQKLISTEFKLPPSFGNTDVMAKDTRIEHMASIFKDLFKNNENTGKIIINECDLGTNRLTEGFLGHNGGIGGAVGNVLIYDEHTNELKFNTARPQFEKAYIFLENLEKILPQGKKLEHYSIKINTYSFPRAKFSDDEYDNIMAKQFLDRLWFYTNQGKEDDVEKSVKIEIEKYYNEHRGRKAFGFRTHIDSIFSAFHNELQKWWMVSTVNLCTRYLTSDDEIFRKAQEGVVESPLLTLHSQIYLNVLKKTGIEFIPESIQHLKLDECTDQFLNIKTNCETFTAIKIQQHYKNTNNYNFISYNYMLSLPLEDRETILEEVSQTSIDILIIIYGLSETEKPVYEDLNRIINSFKGKRVIIVATEIENENVNSHLTGAFKSLRDKMNDFIHFNDDSQNTFTEQVTVKFQDEEVILKDLVDDNFKTKIISKIMSKLMTNIRINIGRSLNNENYENIRELYVPRRLTKQDTDELYPVNSLDDINDQVVLIITKHGTGKSTLFTHIALESKKMNPIRWIIRIDFKNIMNDFIEWKTEGKPINKTKVIKLMCIESLSNINRKTIFDLVERDGKIVLDSNEGIDGIALLELELFLHYYNKSEITFLFYGFDMVCPHFEEESLGLLQIIEADGCPMWIASQSVEYPMKKLIENFGTPYMLQTIDDTAQIGFLYKFWKTMIQMEKVNSELLGVISDLMEFMDANPKIDRIKTPWLSTAVHTIYLVATTIFKTDLFNLPLGNANTELNSSVAKKFDKMSLGAYMDDIPNSKEAAELAGSPLFMYIVANYFAYESDRGKKFYVDGTELRRKLDIGVVVLELYDRFLMHNMNKIYSQSDSSNFDENVERKKGNSYFEKHKKLALFTICTEEDLSKLLPAEEIVELKNTMNRIQNGEEKSALVECVNGNVPKFFYIMYAEHCAVEILIDILKVAGDDSNDIRIHNIWEFIINSMLYSSSNTIRLALDYLLKNDPKVAEFTAGKKCMKIIFDVLLKQHVDGVDAGKRNCWQTAVECRMNNLVKILLMSIQTNITQENKNKFMKVLQTVDIFTLILNILGVDAPTNFTDFFSDMKLDKVADVLKSERAVALPVTLLSCFAESNFVDKARESLERARKRLLDQAAENLGLTEENVELFKQLAKTMKQNNDK